MTACLAIRLLAAAVIVSSPAARADEVVDAGEVFARWSAQQYGFDGLFAYESRADDLVSSFVVARRWFDGHPRVLIDVEEPVEFRNLAFLMRLGPHRAEYWWVVTFDTQNRKPVPRPSWKVRPLPGATLEAFEPEHDARLRLLDFRPIARGEMEHRRLADAVIEGERCFVIESRPKPRDLGFDRLELAISMRSGVALRTSYFRADREHRRVTVRPDDVREFGGRVLPAVRRIESPPGQVEAVMTLQNALIDVDLSERLFTTRSLRRQRFPSF